MPKSGMFLTSKEVAHIGYFLRCMWYASVIEGRKPLKKDIKALKDFVDVFEGDGDENREVTDVKWPLYWNGSDEDIE